MPSKAIFRPYIDFFKQTKPQFIAITFIWLLYALLTLSAPLAVTVNRYGLTLTQTNLLRVTILLPYLIIWWAGLYAVLRLHLYSKQIKGSIEFKGFKQLTLGVCALLAVVIIPPFIGLYAIYYPDAPSVVKVVTILRNNSTVIIYLFSFFFFWKASLNLVKNLSAVDKKISYFKKPIIITAILAIPYIWLVLDNSHRTSSPDPMIRPTYFLSDIQIFLTIVIPYILVWLLGFLTIAKIKTLTSQIEGIIYKKAFSYISNGLILIISLVISLQYLSQATTFFKSAGLGIVLALVYLILFSIGASYIYLAKGAQHLSEIEKI